MITLVFVSLLTFTFVIALTGKSSTEATVETNAVKKVEAAATVLIFIILTVVPEACE